MKILTIIGARPQFVKAGIVSLRLKLIPGLEEIIVHTGQHYDDNMSDIFFRQLEIPTPKYNLQINNLSHGAMTGRMIEAIETIIFKEEPDFCMVYGDTNSTLAGALAAKKLKVKVVHVEAGLRSKNMNMPEEINRILTDRISDVLFCPTETAIKNLKEEGFDNFDCQTHLSGDVMEDAAIFFSSREVLTEETNLIPTQPYILVTIHREENTDNLLNIRSLIDSLNHLSKERLIIFPLHPRTKGILERNNMKLDFIPIHPVGYFQMLQLIKNASLVLTDSGGIQKEAYFFKKFCITLREETEWSELVENGYNFLAGTDANKILNLTDRLFGSIVLSPIDLYGNGTASEYICNYFSEIIRTKYV